MKVKMESCTLLKPRYDGPPPSNASYIPLSIFDTIANSTHVCVIYVFRSPQPSNATLKLGLQRVLSEYREWAGRIARNDRGEEVIFLNDEGVRYVEAAVEEATLDEAMPALEDPRTGQLSRLHPSLSGGGVMELIQIQLTRFSCGSLVVGFTGSHHVADGHSAYNFFVAWGKACRGLDIGPLPTHDRLIFTPRDPPRFEFEHRGFEFATRDMIVDDDDDALQDVVVVQKIHFPVDFLQALQAKASASRSSSSRPYSIFMSLAAHLWRTMTKARGLQGANTSTRVKISVNGRMRMKPKVPMEYFGNLVLWAFPKAEATDVLSEPLSHAAEIIHGAVSKVNNAYFRSFIDFAAHKVLEEDLVSTTKLMGKSILCPNLEIHSWVEFPLHHLNFGGGSPSLFMPSTPLIEGLIHLLPSFNGDGSINAFVHLFRDNLGVFNHNCYTL